MEVNDFEILLIDVTFYFQHGQKLVFNVGIWRFFQFEIIINVLV